MFDKAAVYMNIGDSFSLERLADVNTNMTKAHSHPYYEIYYLLDGERIQVINNNILKIKKNEFVIIAPNIKHYSYGEENVSFDRVLIYFTDDFFISKNIKERFYLLGNNGYSAKESTNTRACIFDLLNSTPVSKNKIEYEKIKLIFNLLLISIIEHKENIINKNMDMSVLKIMNYINDNFSKDICLDDIAREVYLNKYYMCKKFKKYTSHTIYDYLNTTRLTVAEKQLMETNKSITQISSEVGFNNIVSFNRAFKAKNNISPSKFRRTYNEIY
ncbi:AraC family transcriptional regulator [Anaerococcus sp.]|uniref:AraC family transcriptional regulator n=1 Tax=Anaerococcus TaxID=165779 RepID=UPI0029021613|nr:AraC family transcriptional regulator [Anaerococcus sp.]MDU2566040.1 AraC family transcriptional regulator [Anaerococcus sp.]